MPQKTAKRQIQKLHHSGSPPISWVITCTFLPKHNVEALIRCAHACHEARTAQRFGSSHLDSESSVGRTCDWQKVKEHIKWRGAVKTLRVQKPTGKKDPHKSIERCYRGLYIHSGCLFLELQYFRRIVVKLLTKQYFLVLRGHRGETWSILFNALVQGILGDVYGEPSYITWNATEILCDHWRLMQSEKFWISHFHDETSSEFSNYQEIWYTPEG